MAHLFFASFGLSWLVIASAGDLCSPMATEGQAGCSSGQGIGAALIQRQLQGSKQVIADEVGADSQKGETTLGHALSFVTALAEKSAGHNWTMTGEERLAIQTIADMIEDLFNGSMIQFNEDQAEVNMARDRIVDCSEDADTHHDTVVTPQKEQANRSRLDHAQCRRHENIVIMHTHHHCTLYHNYRKNPSNFEPFPDCMGTALTWSNIRTDEHAAKHAMEACLVLTVETLKPMYDLYLGCRDWNWNRTNTSVTCNGKQTKFEDDFCDYASSLHSKCEEHSNCVNRKIAERNATYAEVRKAEVARKADWTTATHIKCLLQVFEKDNANKTAQLNDCVWADVDTSSITINYPGIPPPVPCPVEDHVPCDDTWLEREYRTQDWYNGTAMTSCTPCPSLG